MDWTKILRLIFSILFTYSFSWASPESEISDKFSELRLKTCDAAKKQGCEPSQLPKAMIDQLEIICNQHDKIFKCEEFREKVKPESREKFVSCQKEELCKGLEPSDWKCLETIAVVAKELAIGVVMTPIDLIKLTGAALEHSEKCSRNIVYKAEIVKRFNKLVPERPAELNRFRLSEGMISAYLKDGFRCEDVEKQITSRYFSLQQAASNLARRGELPKDTEIKGGDNLFSPVKEDSADPEQKGLIQALHDDLKKSPVLNCLNRKTALELVCSAVTVATAIVVGGPTARRAILKFKGELDELGVANDSKWVIAAERNARLNKASFNVREYIGAIDKGAGKSEIIKLVKRLSDSERLQAAEILLGRELTTSQKETLIAAHHLPMDDPNMLRRKAEMLRDGAPLADGKPRAGPEREVFSRREREALMRGGIAGEFPDLPGTANGLTFALDMSPHAATSKSQRELRQFWSSNMEPKDLKGFDQVIDVSGQTFRMIEKHSDGTYLIEARDGSRRVLKPDELLKARFSDPVDAQKFYVERQSGRRFVSLDAGRGGRIPAEIVEQSADGSVIVRTRDGNGFQRHRVGREQLPLLEDSDMAKVYFERQGVSENQRRFRDAISERSSVDGQEIRVTVNGKSLPAEVVKSDPNDFQVRFRDSQKPYRLNQQELASAELLTGRGARSDIVQKPLDPPVLPKPFNGKVDLPPPSPQLVDDFKRKLDAVAPRLQEHKKGTYISNGHWREWIDKSRDKFPHQGFKLHVGIKPEVASRLATDLLPELRKQKIYHKVVEDLEKYAKGGVNQINTQVGKFISIYPKDAADAKRIADLIAKYLKEKGYRGSDFLYPVGDAPLDMGISYRYGRLRTETFVSARGQTIPPHYIELPDGRIVYDDRNVPVPPGIRAPF